MSGLAKDGQDGVPVYRRPPLMESTGGSAGRRRWRLAGNEMLAVGCVAAVLAVLALVGTGAWPGHTGSAARDPAVTAASGVPVVVSLDEFAVTPSTITVAPGTDLVLAVRNTGRMSHDLRLDGQHGTHTLAPGQRQTIDLGIIERDEQAWCTVPGHREAGMSLTIRTSTAPTARAGQ